MEYIPATQVYNISSFKFHCHFHLHIFCTLLFFNIQTGGQLIRQVSGAIILQEIHCQSYLVGRTLRALIRWQKQAGN